MNDKAIDPVHEEILSNEVSDDALRTSVVETDRTYRLCTASTCVG
jgi:hypothetical protein